MSHRAHWLLVYQIKVLKSRACPTHTGLNLEGVNRRPGGVVRRFSWSDLNSVCLKANGHCISESLDTESLAVTNECVVRHDLPSRFLFLTYWYYLTSVRGALSTRTSKISYRPSAMRMSMSVIFSSLVEFL